LASSSKARRAGKSSLETANFHPFVDWSKKGLALALHL
jgi:hypothetical protein